MTLTDTRIARIAAELQWDETSTGGGCRALMHGDPMGEYFLITTEEGSQAPQWGDDFVIGQYNDEATGGNEELRMWHATFVPNCDAHGTPGYTTDVNGMAIFDPMVGSDICWDMPVDPVEVYDMPMPVALFLSALYNTKGA